MPHFRTFMTRDDFCSADLWSEKGQCYGEIVVQFVSIKKGEVIGEGGRKKGMPFVTMRSQRTGQVIQKPLGLNPTNCKTIRSLTGSANTDKWLGGPWFTLFVISTTVNREQVDAIRIKPELAKAAAPTATDAKPDAKPAADAPATNPADLADDEKRAIEMAERLENGDA